MSDPVFCKDCNYVKKNALFGWKMAKCIHPSSKKRDSNEFLVSGKFNSGEYFYCSIQRVSDCGTEGKYFEPKKEEDRKVFLVLKKLDWRNHG